MGLLVEYAARVSSVLLAAAVRSQEGFPLDDTWRGEWGRPAAELAHTAQLHTIERL